MKRIFSNSSHSMKVAGVALGFAFSGICSASTPIETSRVKMYRQTEEALIRALIRAGVTSEKMVLPPSSSTLPEPSQSDFVSVTEAMGFTGSDLQIGGTLKTRLEHITATLVDHVNSSDELRNRIEQIDCERKRDMNFFVAQMNALHTEIRFLTALTITTEILNQEILDQSPMEEEELRTYILGRTDSILNALPKQEVLSPLYLCCCPEPSNPEQKPCPSCGSPTCSCSQDKTETTTPPDEEDEAVQIPGDDKPVDPSLEENASSALGGDGENNGNEDDLLFDDPFSPEENTGDQDPDDDLYA